MAQGFFDEDAVRFEGAGDDHLATQTFPESQAATLSWLKHPEATYINYGCRIECLLDPGTALHKPLPQSAQPYDTLGTYDVAAVDTDLIVTGENLRSAGSYRDVVQRMATSTYRFLLTGFGVRVGFPIPVPSLKTVAGVPAIPANQWVQGNQVIGNLCGIPVFNNAWRLWYYVTAPPARAQVPPPNLADRIAADVTLPDVLSVPVAPNDYNAVTDLKGKTVKSSK
jgi:hypothetical protein